MVKMSLSVFKVDDKEAFPNYPYRDDALLIHEAIYTYVREVLEAFYGEQILFCGYNFSFCYFVKSYVWAILD